MRDIFFNLPFSLLLETCNATVESETSDIKS